MDDKTRNVIVMEAARLLCEELGRELKEKSMIPIRQAAKLTGCSIKTLYRRHRVMIAEGRIGYRDLVGILNAMKPNNNHDPETGFTL